MAGEESLVSTGDEEMTKPLEYYCRWTGHNAMKGMCGETDPAKFDPGFKTRCSKHRALAELLYKQRQATMNRTRTYDIPEDQVTATQIPWATETAKEITEPAFTRWHYFRMT